MNLRTSAATIAISVALATAAAPAAAQMQAPPTPTPAPAPGQTPADTASAQLTQDGQGAPGGPTAAVEGIATSDYPTPARRPANSLLSHDAIRTAYGIDPRPWDAALADILDELIGAPQ